MVYSFQVMLVGHYKWPCEGDLVVKSAIEDVPYFNAPVYLEDKKQIGKIDEIFGSIRDYYFSVKLSEDLFAKSFSSNQKVSIN